MVQKIFIAFIVALIAAYSFATWSANAVTNSPSVSVTVVPVVLETSTSTASVSAISEGTEYTLPYPGILPDHPLYKIKLVRDRILDFLIRDPIKRIEFNLLMADKRLNMGAFLAEKGNAKLAEETISKGEKYFVRAIDEIDLARSQSRKPESSLINTLKKSLQKHEEVVVDLLSQSPEEQKVGYENSLTVIRQNSSRLSSLGE